MMSPAEVVERDEPQATQSSPTVMTTPSQWSGFYLGLNAGAGFSDNAITTTGQATANVNNVNGGARPASTSVNSKGFIGGGQIGYTHQFGKFVAGLETDLSATTISGQRTVITTALTGGASLNNNFGTEMKYLGTARTNLGFAFGRTLLYGTGGFAYAKTEHSADLFGPSPANVKQFTSSNNSVKGGYTVGGGLEHKFSRKLSMKAEYLYYRLGNDTLNVAVIAGSGGGGTGYNSRFENKGNLARLGINYRF